MLLENVASIIKFSYPNKSAIDTVCIFLDL